MRHSKKEVFVLVPVTGHRWKIDKRETYASSILPAFFVSRHPETGVINPVAEECLYNLFHIARNSADQSDAGRLKHSVKYFADAAANNGIRVQFFLRSQNVRIGNIYQKKSPAF